MSRQEKSTPRPVPPSTEYFLNTQFARKCLRYFRATRDKPRTGSGRGWELREAYLKKHPGCTRKPKRITKEGFKTALVSFQQLLYLKSFKPPPDGRVN